MRPIDRCFGKRATVTLLAISLVAGGVYLCLRPMAGVETSGDQRGGAGTNRPRYVLPERDEDLIDSTTPPAATFEEWARSVSVRTDDVDQLVPTAEGILKKWESENLRPFQGPNDGQSIAFFIPRPDESVLSEIARLDGNPAFRESPQFQSLLARAGIDLDQDRAVVITTDPNDPALDSATTFIVDGPDSISVDPFTGMVTINSVGLYAGDWKATERYAHLFGVSVAQ